MGHAELRAYQMGWVMQMFMLSGGARVYYIFVWVCHADVRAFRVYVCVCVGGGDKHLNCMYVVPL